MPLELTRIRHTPGPWSLIARCGHRLLCADGVIRAAELASTADTFFSVPAKVRVRGKWVSGYATTTGADGNTTGGGPVVHQFRQHVNGANAGLLPRWPEHSYSAEMLALLAKGVAPDPALTTACIANR